MKVRIISPDDYLINFSAEDEFERKIIDEYWKNGIRVVSGGSGSISIASPAVAGVKIQFLTGEERKILMKALITYKKSTTESDLVKRLLLELID
jgi:hypothetical protein